MFAEFGRDILRESVKIWNRSDVREAVNGRPGTVRLYVKEVRKLHANGKGLSKAAIASSLNIGRSSVQHMLS